MDPTYRSLIMQRRKKSNRKGFLPALLAGLAGVNIVSQLGKSLFNRGSKIGLGQTLKNKYRKGLSLDMAKRGIKPKKGLIGSTGRKGRSMPKLTNFDRKKSIIAKKIIQSHLLGPRKAAFSRRKGDLDSSFLNEFGQDVFDPEPTTTKTWKRTAFDSLKNLWGTKQGEKAILSKIDKLSGKKAQLIADKIIRDKPIPKRYENDLVPNRFLGKYRG